MKRLALGLMLGVIAMSGACMCSKPAHGIKTGVIVKLAQEGWFVPTWEGQLIRGGMVDGSGAMGQAFDFNVKAGPALEAAKAALESGAEVEIEYDRPMFASLVDREHEHSPCVVRVTVRAAPAAK